MRSLKWIGTGQKGPAPNCLICRYFSRGPSLCHRPPRRCTVLNVSSAKGKDTQCCAGKGHLISRGSVQKKITENLKGITAGMTQAVDVEIVVQRRERKDTQRNAEI